MVNERREGGLLVHLGPQLQAYPQELLRQRRGPDGAPEYLVRWRVVGAEERAAGGGGGGGGASCGGCGECPRRRGVRVHVCVCVCVRVCVSTREAAAPLLPLRPRVSRPAGLRGSRGALSVVLSSAPGAAAPRRL